MLLNQPQNQYRHARSINLQNLTNTTTQSGVHWSWGNRQRADARPFAQALSPKANTPSRASRLWDISMRMVGL